MFTEQLMAKTFLLLSHKNLNKIVFVVGVIDSEDFYFIKGYIMAKLMIRSVNETDYQFMHNLLIHTWYQGDNESKELNHALAKMYLNHILNRSTTGYIAEINGEQMGFILANIVKEEPILRQLQADTYDDLMTILNATPEEMTANLNYMAREQAVNAEMLEANNTDFDAEIGLLIVAEKARGMGAGKRLFQKTFAEFEQANVKNYYLFTDDGCNYQFYEDKNMHRSQARSFNPKNPLEESSFNLYLYKNNE